MDQEVAKTLGELERKLLELERTLNAMGSDGQQGAGGASRTPLVLPRGAGARAACRRTRATAVELELEQDRGRDGRAGPAAVGGVRARPSALRRGACAARLAASERTASRGPAADAAALASTAACERGRAPALP